MAPQRSCPECGHHEIEVQVSAARVLAGGRLRPPTEAEEAQTLLGLGDDTDATCPSCGFGEWLADFPVLDPGAVPA